MVESSEKRQPGPTINPYRRSNDAGSQPGNRAVCELCGHRRLCIEEYGLTACRTCRHDLLPAGGVL